MSQNKKRTLTQEQKEKNRIKKYENRRSRKSDPSQFGITEYTAIKNRITTKSKIGRILEFDLTPDFIQDLFDKSGRKCAITGIPFQMELGKPYKRNPFRPSIDRIDSKRGYTKDNIQIVLSIVNTMRLDYSDDIINQVIIAWYNKNLEILTI